MIGLGFLPPLPQSGVSLVNTVDYTSGSGTYTAEGINKLCKSLKGSSITSLRCVPSL